MKEVACDICDDVPVVWTGELERREVLPDGGHGPIGCVRMSLCEHHRRYLVDDDEEDPK